MKKSSSRISKLMAVILALMVMLTAGAMTAGAIPASGSTVVDWNATGDLTIIPKYGETPVTGECTFKLYKVADLVKTPEVTYVIPSGSAFEAYDGQPLNTLGDPKSTEITNAELKDAAEKLAALVVNFKESEATSSNFRTLNKLDGATSVTFEDLGLGVWLMVQTASPANYINSVPAIIYVPHTETADTNPDSSTNGDTSTSNPTETPNYSGSYWAYDLTITAKMGYNYIPGPEYTSVKVTKLWSDEGFEATRPASVTAVLLQNGVEYAQGGRQVLNAGNLWTYTWSMLPLGYTYTVTELTVPENYHCIIENNGNTFTMTNFREEIPLSFSLSVNKLWDDGNNADGIRPETVSVGLYKDGALFDTKTVSEATGWACAWTGLDIAFVWTAAELDVPDGYVSTIQNNNGIYYITNTRETGKSITVEKVWSDDNDAKGLRPDSVTIGLYNGNNLYETVVLSAANGWKHAWTGLDANGVWSVDELNVPKGYMVMIDEVDGGYVITNFTDEVPLAGMLQWPIPVLGVLGVGLVTAGYIGNKNKKKYAK